MVDLSRAFDKVDHTKLLDQFDKLQIPSCYGKWYRSFLRDRKCRVVYGDSKSSWSRFDTGVPQGSVSGPLLFIIFMNSLGQCLHNGRPSGLQFQFFADDITLWASNQSVDSCADVVQQGLNIVHTWCREFGMPISIGKNEAILFTNYSPDLQQNQLPVLHIGEDQVQFKKDVRLLGVQLDSKMTFSAHVEKIRRECKFRLSQMTTISGKTWGGSCRDLRGLYIAYIRSILEYAAPVWASSIADNKLKCLEAIQNTGARIATGLRKTTDVESLLLEANLIPLQQRYQYLSAVMLEKYRRFPTDDPLFQKANGNLPKVKQSLVKPKLPWRTTADNTLQMILNLFDYEQRKIGNREQILLYQSIAPSNTLHIIDKIFFFFFFHFCLI